MSAGKARFAELTRLSSAKNGRLKSWRQEKNWPGHLEFGDGGRLLSGETTLRIQFAWRELTRKNDGDPAGEALWSVSGLKASQKAALLLSMKPIEWKFADIVTPSSPILMTGLNIPAMPGTPSGWPFPLSTAADLVNLLELREVDMREVLSGKTVFTLGGRNRFLWFTLPGLLVEFSGKEPLMRQLVESFWSNFFLGSETKPLEGWDYGGTVSFPFSVVGASRGNSALIGVISAESLKAGDWLTDSLPGEERAVGWLVADLPKLGESLGEMAKMASLLAFEDGEDDGYISGEAESGDKFGSGRWSETGESVPFSPSDLDQDTIDSLSRLLRNFGKVSVVWEQPESGKMYWY